MLTCCQSQYWLSAASLCAGTAAVRRRWVRPGPLQYPLFPQTGNSCSLTHAVHIDNHRLKILEFLKHKSRWKVLPCYIQLESLGSCSRAAKIRGASRKQTGDGEAQVGIWPTRGFASRSGLGLSLSLGQFGDFLYQTVLHTSSRMIIFRHTHYIIFLSFLLLVFFSDFGHIK